MVARCMCLDRVIVLVQDFVVDTLGPEFVEAPTSDFQAAYDESSCTVPIIFLLTPGSDPMSELNKLGERLGYSDLNNTFAAVSLGQGQGPLAESLIGVGVDSGTWVCLQNCHLATSWLPSLQRVVEELSEETCHTNFRLWLTSMRSDDFPVSVLEKSVKLTVEPPQGIKMNLKTSYIGFKENEEWFEGCRRPAEFKKLLFALVFFHASIRERRRFGPLGWNIPYSFSIPDLKMSQDQLRLFLDLDTDDIPWKLLNYTVAHCNYGGRVTDDKDRRCMVELLTDFYCDKVLDDAYKFSSLDDYYAPAEGDCDSYLAFIEGLPLNEPPECFGLHPNANITCAISETQRLLKDALSLQPRSVGGGGKSADEVLRDLAVDVNAKIPDIFDVEKVEVQYPTDYKESMNTVLTQELGRFNALLALIRRTLVDLQKALRGELVMSTELEKLGASMANGWVPDLWANIAYESLKPLGSWVLDLLKRLEMLSTWVDLGPPPTYWISGFFFTQAFLTGTRQNYARRNTIPIDETAFDFVVFDAADAAAIDHSAKDGAYVYGLLVDGARFDAEECVLEHSFPKVRISNVAVCTYSIPLALLTQVVNFSHIYNTHTIGPTSGVLNVLFCRSLLVRRRQRSRLCICSRSELMIRALCT